MKHLGILFLVLMSQEFCIAVTVPNEVKRVDRFQKHNYNGVSRKAVFPFRRQDDDDDSSSSSGSSSSDDSTKSAGTSKFKDLKVPMLNFYSSVPNSLGFVGMGLLWIREFSNVLGTPLPIYILTLPLLLLGVGFIFIPDLTQLGLPLFFGSSISSDLDKLPTLQDLADLANFDFVKQAGQLLPPGLLNKRG